VGEIVHRDLDPATPTDVNSATRSESPNPLQPISGKVLIRLIDEDKRAFINFDPGCDQRVVQLSERCGFRQLGLKDVELAMDLNEYNRLWHRLLHFRNTVFLHGESDTTGEKAEVDFQAPHTK
jgi:hypothetical protein